MTTLLLIRHGSTEAVGHALTGSTTDTPLSELGRKEARRLSQAMMPFGLEAIATSPLRRTQETAQIIAQACGLLPKVVPNLTDVDFGQWAGRQLSELRNDEGFRAFNRHRSHLRIPGGEHLVEVQARMVRECLALVEGHDGKTVAMVSHLDPLRLLLGVFLGMNLDFTDRIDLAPASLTGLQIHPEGATLLFSNLRPGELGLH
jgi:probable phosphoglycerate mutase